MSNLNDAFWKWFGKSKTVDENGNPIVYWRGEAYGGDFDCFDRQETTENGFFLTENETVALIYARGGKGTLRSFYVRAPRLLDLSVDSLQNMKWVKEWSENFDDWIDRQSGEEVSAWDILQAGQMFDYEGDWSGDRWLSIQGEAENQGYDAVILPDYDSSYGVFNVIVVFDPKNIKSTENVGTWDPNDCNVRRNPIKVRPESFYDPVELAIGIEVEREHTNSERTASKIARQHLEEIPDYYSRLIEMEEKAKREKKRASRR